MSTPPEGDNALPPVTSNASDSDAIAPQSPSLETLQQQLLDLQKERDEYKEKHSANRKGIDEYSATIKDLKSEVARLKVIAGEDDEEETEPEQKYLTKEDLWEHDHKSELELYQSEISEILEKGLDGEPVTSKKVALALAKKQSKSVPIPPASKAPIVDRSGEGETKHGLPTDVFNYWKEKLKDKKLSDDRIAEIIKASLSRSQKMGKVAI